MHRELVWFFDKESGDLQRRRDGKIRIALLCCLV